MLSLCKRSVDVLCSTDPVLRGHASAAWLALALMLANSGVMASLAHAGYASLQAVAWWALWANGGLLAMALVVRSGWRAKAANSGLHFAQIVWAVTSSAVAYALVGEAKGVVPALLAVNLLFAALSLRASQIVAITLYTLLAFAAATLGAGTWAGGQAHPLEWAYGAVLLIMLLGSMLLSLRLYGMRMRLRRQRQDLLRALKSNRELAARDPLTGLLNRRHMLELLYLEQRRCLRGERQMLLAQLDLDYFKSINDNFGHAVGDKALLTFCQVVQANIRASDVLSRWGGEEFVLLLSDTDIEGARLTLERVRQAVEQALIDGAPSMFRMTVSAGLAQHLPGETVERTLDRADQALYCAKRAGRNTVVVGPLQPPIPVSAATASLAPAQEVSIA